MLRLVALSVLITAAFAGCAGTGPERDRRVIGLDFVFETEPVKPYEQLPPIIVVRMDGRRRLNDQAMAAINEFAGVRARACRNFSRTEDRSYSLDFINRDALGKAYRSLQDVEIGDGRKMTNAEIEALLDWITIWTACN